MQPFTDLKLQQYKHGSLWANLPASIQPRVIPLAEKNRFSFQEFKIFVEQCIDYHSWDGKSLIDEWDRWTADKAVAHKSEKKVLFKKLTAFMNEKRQTEVIYELSKPSFRPRPSTPVKLVDSSANQKIFGMCPVQSEKTLCCNLRTIDAVKNCGFGCSYCSIQTMFNDSNILFEKDFAKKLDAIELEPDKFYHIGTGQSSDSLLWGNRFKILDSLMHFARKHPNILLEFKTKSKNIDYFLKHSLPSNLVCSWSLSPQKIIINEEHRTASENERLDCARKLADKGVKVSFHFHPIMHYQGWQEDYEKLIETVMARFTSDEILFISFGTLSLPKTIIKTVRSQGIPSKILQTPLIPNPEGKMTYPQNIKENIFSTVFKKFKPWHKDIFFYLCMEEAKYWLSTFGWAYSSNAAFEQDFEKSICKKMSTHFH